MITNLGKYAHPPKSGGRNIGAGRHNAGANPAPGSTFKPKNAGSQAEPASNKATGGSKAFGAPKNPITSPANQAVQAQSQIAANPAPFKNPAGPANASAPATMPYGSTFKHTSGLSGGKAPKNPNAGPVGGFKPKTQGLMVGVNFPGKKKKGAMNVGATKGGHSLLYGD